MILSIPTDALTVIIAVIGCAICTLHLASGLLRGRVATALAYFNLILHVTLFGLLMLSGAEEEMCLLAFMISLFVFVSVRYLRHELSLRRKTGEKTTSDEKETENDL